MQKLRMKAVRPANLDFPGVGEMESSSMYKSAENRKGLKSQLSSIKQSPISANLSISSEPNQGFQTSNLGEISFSPSISQSGGGILQIIIDADAIDTPSPILGQPQHSLFPNKFIDPSEVELICTGNKEPLLDCVGFTQLKPFGSLGEGFGGQVQKCLHIPTQTKIALKIIPPPQDAKLQEYLMTQIQTLNEHHCQYLIGSYGAFMYDGLIYIALEYMDRGSLQGLLKKVNIFNESIVGLITAQILKGLEYLHKAHRIHRDLKPSNILLNKRGEVKIADFGVSGMIENSMQPKHTWVGTAAYMSPERFRGEEYFSDTDLWSLGLIMTECAIGRYPLCQPDQALQKLQLADLMEWLNFKPAPSLPDTVSECMQDFISICLNKQPKMRSSAGELQHHSFMQEYIDEEKYLLRGWLQHVFK